MKKIIKLSFILCFISIQACANSPTKEDCDNVLVKSTNDKKSILKVMKGLMQQENIVMNEKKPSNQVLPKYECAKNGNKNEK